MDSGRCAHNIVRFPRPVLARRSVMSSMPNPFGSTRPLGYESRADASVVAPFFNIVYAWMAAGLAVTALVAWFVSTRADIQQLVFNMPVLIGLFIAQIALVWTISA